MTIKISENLIKQLYNPNEKILYLKTIKKNQTQKSYAIELIRVGKYEKSNEKELYDFTEKDILRFFADESKNINSISPLKNLFSVCNRYIKWAIDNDLKKIGTNPLENINFNTDIGKMVNVNNIKKNYLTEEELWEISNQCVNAQDKLCLILPFYGVSGKNKYELINLKYEQVNEQENTVTIQSSNGSTRKIILPKKVIELIKDANEERVYQTTQKNRIVELLESDYVLKQLRGDIYPDQIQVSDQIIARRVKELLEETEYKYISIKNIRISGQLHNLNIIEKSKGKLEIKDYMETSVLFGDKNTSYHNTKDTYKVWKSNDYKGELLDYINEDYINCENLYEGSECSFDKKVYSRSIRARNICIEHYGAKCFICNFDFKDMYGDVGKNVIHVHHLIPLSNNKESHKVHPIKDLRPVCPNCHLMLHRKNPPYTIEAVKEMIKLK